MSQLKSDEKLCPFCAETIKAAAIRCRYCQSDLTAGTPTESTPVRGGSDTVGFETLAGARSSTTDQPTPRPPFVEEYDAVPTVPSESSEIPARSGWSGSFLVGPLLTGILSVVALALAVACIVVQTVGGNDGTAPNGTVVSADVRAAAMSQASDLTQRTLSYDYKSFDTLRKTNAARMSSHFRKQYDDTMNKVAAKTKQYQVSLVAKVVASGVVSVTAQRAQVLLFVNQTTTAAARPKDTPVTDLNRVLVTLVRSGGDWNIDAIDALAK
ncbi:MAG: hypothetical protein M3Y66_04915 [Actinomycetota bacterium]|nr:hypothetical protein [Actinomycetota bacterium]